MKVEKIVGRLLLTDQLNKEEAILLLGGVPDLGETAKEENVKIGLWDVSPQNALCYCGCGCLDGQVCSCSCGCHTTLESDIEKDEFVPVHDYKVEDKEEEVKETIVECNDPLCGCHKGWIIDYSQAAKTFVEPATSLITYIKHQPYCKGKGGLAENDCICCHYTFSAIDGIPANIMYNADKSFSGKYYNGKGELLGKKKLND